MVRGAGGTSGGAGTYFIGLAMLCGGVYLLLQSITVSVNFGMGMRLFGVGMFGQTFGITSGMIMVPFVFGVVMVFYNARNYLGWLLFGGSMIGMVFGVLASTRFVMRTMTAFELITILVLCAGGLGLFLRSLRDADS